jgi:hypothetical protein
MNAKLVIAFIVVFLSVLLILMWLQPAQKAPAALPAVETATPSESPKPHTAPASAEAPMVFSRIGANARIVEEVEKVCGENNSKVAMQSTAHGRRVCIVVADERRYYSLELDQRPEQFGFLQKMAFAAAPPPIEKTMSIYRSVAKTAMLYNSAAGDRIIILLCDRNSWPLLDLKWPVDAR